MMRRKVTYWFVLILSAMFMVSCSDDDKQDGGEVGKVLLVGLWESQSVEGSTGEYRECFDFRVDGTFTVYDYENGEGWYDDGVGVWEYNNNNLALTYSDQSDVFTVKSITENELVLVKPGSDGSTITVTYRKIPSIEIIVLTAKKKLVGVWSGEVGYDCSNGNHRLERGMIIFEKDDTGVLKYPGEGTYTFHYEIDEVHNQILINFDDDRKGVFQYTELSKKRLTFVEECASCGDNVYMRLQRVDLLRTIEVYSTDGYTDTYTFFYNKQADINGIKYTSVDTEYGDHEEADINVAYRTNQVILSNAVVDGSPYSVTYTLNAEGTVKSAVSALDISGRKYTSTLNFAYDSYGYLSEVRSSAGGYDGKVAISWNAARQLNRMVDQEKRKTDFVSQSTSVPNVLIDIPYFMIFRYDGDVVATEDNTALLYASMLNLLGKGSSHLLGSAIRYEDNSDWETDFQFDYQWGNDGKLIGIHDTSSYYDNKVRATEVYETQINISYY